MTVKTTATQTKSKFYYNNLLTTSGDNIDCRLEYLMIEEVEQDDNSASKNNYNELLEKLEQLQIVNKGEDSLLKSNGNTNIEGFLLQFNKFQDVYPYEKLMSLIESRLEGKALHWFKGAKGIWFKSLSGFKREFKEMFVKEDMTDNEKVINSLLKGCRRGFLEEKIIELFGLSRQSTLKREEILNTLCKKFKMSNKERIINTCNWKETIKVALFLDEEFKTKENKAKKIKQNNTSNVTSNFLGKQNTNIQEVVCYNCKVKGHTKTNCPKLKNETQSLNVSVATGNRAYITVDIKEKRFFALVDGGATRSFIKKDIVEMLDLPIEKMIDEMVLAVGRSRTEGTVEALVSDVKGMETATINFIVSSELSQNIILGVDSIKAFSLLSNYIQDIVKHSNDAITEIKPVAYLRVNSIEVNSSNITKIDIEDKVIESMVRITR